MYFLLYICDHIQANFNNFFKVSLAFAACNVSLYLFSKDFFKKPLFFSNKEKKSFISFFFNKKIVSEAFDCLFIKNKTKNTIF